SRPAGSSSSPRPPERRRRSSARQREPGSERRELLILCPRRPQAAPLDREVLLHVARGPAQGRGHPPLAYAPTVEAAPGGSLRERLPKVLAGADVDQRVRGERRTQVGQGPAGREEQAAAFRRTPIAPKTLHEAQEAGAGQRAARLLAAR